MALGVMTPRRYDGVVAPDQTPARRRLQRGASVVNGPRRSGDRNEDVPALVGVAPYGELPDSRFQYLAGTKARVLRSTACASVAISARCMAQLRRRATSFAGRSPVAGGRTRRAERFGSPPDRQEDRRAAPVPRRRGPAAHRGASEIERHRTVQHSPCPPVLDGGDPHPSEHLVERVGVSEDMGAASESACSLELPKRAPERRAGSERSAKISGSGARRPPP